MSAVTFDTLKYVETLKVAGVPEHQARAQSDALKVTKGSGLALTHFSKCVNARPDPARCCHYEELCDEVIQGLTFWISTTLRAATLRSQQCFVAMTAAPCFLLFNQKVCYTPQIEYVKEKS